MIINHESFGTTVRADFGGGLAHLRYHAPGRAEADREVDDAGGKGVHRFDFDGRYAYISPTAEGYVGNIVMILDLLDPAHPVEVGRWWIPGPVGSAAVKTIPGTTA